jgi:hypothetical protein
VDNLRQLSNQYTPTKKPAFPPRKSSLGRIRSISPFSRSHSSSTSTLASQGSYSEVARDSSPSSNQDSSPNDKETWAKCETLTNNLDDLEQAIDDYPSCLLQLNSPIILQIRDPQSLDELHIDRLRKIFPTARTRQLSALAATLIAQSYLTTIAPLPDAIPISKYSRLAAASNESLNNIPTKAMTALGIRLANVTSAQERERALRKRAKVVEAALHVIVQKIMVLVCGRYDEVLWRSLKCLIETVEQGW